VSGLRDDHALLCASWCIAMTEASFRRGGRVWPRAIQCGAALARFAEGRPSCAERDPGLKTAIRRTLRAFGGADLTLDR